jgi:hypothetical protein
MNTNTISLKNNVLTPNFGGIKSRQYNVSVKYFDGETFSPSKRIDYHSEITIITKGSKLLCSIYKDSFWFNRHEPDLISELIADELSKTIYPVQVEINDKAVFQRITNFDYMVNNYWHRNEFRTTEKYTTKVAQSFYDAFERNLKNRNVFEKSMQYDLFWNLLFHPKYIDYGNKHSVKTDFYLAVVPYEYPIPFTGVQKINTAITDYYAVEIYFQSDEMEAHPYFIPKDGKTTSGYTFYMQLNVYYDLDVYYLFPMHTRAYFEVYSKDTEGKKTPVKRIEFTQYQQNTESNKTAPPEERSPFLVYEEEDGEKEVYMTYEGKNFTYQEWVTFEEEQYKIYKEKQKKKGFWDFLG